MSTDRPTVVCLCGSTRFRQAFDLANLHESLSGKIVISRGSFGHADHPEGARFLTSDGDESTPEKRALDQLHFRKIDLADEILVVNVGGYVGSSTKREIAYARDRGLSVRWLFPDAAHDAVALAEARADLYDRHFDVVREAVARLRPLARNAVDGAPHQDPATCRQHLMEAIEHIQRMRPTDLQTEPEEVLDAA